MTPKERSRARRTLLHWYDAHKRDLPWRETHDPYAIWVSEIMLQQTRVETVIPYFERFLARFPDVTTLAAADEDAVLGEWSGLGYYRRARLLHRGAREVVARYGGEVPAGREARLGLPGVGRYTAGAIGSIAFGLEEPIVDGNVARVLSRVHTITTPLGTTATETRLWQEAEAWVRGARPGDLNQALMELGATVCTPSSADCGSCPLRAVCTGKARAHELPVPKPKKKPKRVQLVALRVERGDAVLLERRRSEGTFAGLWIVPRTERGDDTVTSARAHLRSLGVRGARIGAALTEVQHVLSHRHLFAEVRPVTHARVAETDDLRFVERSTLRSRELGLSTFDRKLLAAGQ